ncbi:helix-turn-helix domain-containing protein [Anditalea andensis]|uniref:XRE family transcriptional regulator n=1 Tax=Anditalea andensis TaxID=1048983 RepID=A0A074KUM8_9BACT|nr:XRE family transcriptional regulator [Anditalea andensis]KEO71980.1 XRE family transcriptional regulator [Anditalea andensis]
MENEILAQISQKIKSIRKEKGLTIQGIADRAGVTKGLISQVENSKTIPSLMVLMQIIKALEVDLDFFFNHMSLQGRDAPILVLRKEEYEGFENEPASDFHYERIISKKIKSSAVDVVLLEIQPYVKKHFDTTEAYAFKYILEGSIKYVFRDQTVVLHPGDSMLFDGRLDHHLVNEYDVMTKMLVVYFNENIE